LIVLDTSVLSLALRRRNPNPRHPAVQSFRELLSEDIQLVVPGIVFQELLGGVRSDRQFEELLQRLLTFTVVAASIDHHLSAAHSVNVCRSCGIAVTSADALIAAQTIAYGGQLFTLDQNFERIAETIGLALFKP
jgi:predicted nucleic acid-binding protein